MGAAVRAMPGVVVVRPHLEHGRGRDRQRGPARANLLRI
jgi:hypothetical protein